MPKNIPIEEWRVGKSVNEDAGCQDFPEQIPAVFCAESHGLAGYIQNSSIVGIPTRSIVCAQ